MGLLDSINNSIKEKKLVSAIKLQEQIMKRIFPYNYKDSTSISFQYFWFNQDKVWRYLYSSKGELVCTISYFNNGEIDQIKFPIYNLEEKSKSLPFHSTLNFAEGILLWSKDSIEEYGGSAAKFKFKSDNQYLPRASYFKDTYLPKFKFEKRLMSMSADQLEKETKNLYFKLGFINFNARNLANANISTFTESWITKSEEGFDNDLALDSLIKAEKAGRILKYGKYSKNSISYLSTSYNLMGLNFINNIYRQYNNELKRIPKNIKILHFDDINLKKKLKPHELILKEDWQYLSNLLAGEAGEYLLDASVKVSAIKKHNVILPYAYSNNDLDNMGDNQIDNVYITPTGIYCVEVKTREIKNGYFDISKVAGLPDQVAFHKEAVIRLLRNSNNPSIKSIGSFPEELVHSVVVIVNRENKPFKIINDDYFKKMGTEVITKDLLNLLLLNENTSVYLTHQDMINIGNLIEANQLPNKRLYKNNCIFFNDRKFLSNNKVSYSLEVGDIVKHMKIIQKFTALLKEINDHTQNVVDLRDEMFRDKDIAITATRVIKAADESNVIDICRNYAIDRRNDTFSDCINLTAEPIEAFPNATSQDFKNAIANIQASIPANTDYQQTKNVFYSPLGIDEIDKQIKNAFN